MVKAGFGYSVIRLGHEMNGSWYIDDIGNTPTQWRQWAEYFAQIVKTMRAVPGAHFLFDWNVNARYRDIPLAAFIPGTPTSTSSASTSTTLSEGRCRR